MEIDFEKMVTTVYNRRIAIKNIVEAARHHNFAVCKISYPECCVPTEKVACLKIIGYGRTFYLYIFDNGIKCQCENSKGDFEFSSLTEFNEIKWYFGELEGRQKNRIRNW